MQPPAPEFDDIGELHGGVAAPPTVLFQPTIQNTEGDNIGVTETSSDGSSFTTDQMVEQGDVYTDSRELMQDKYSSSSYDDYKESEGDKYVNNVIEKFPPSSPFFTLLNNNYRGWRPYALRPSFYNNTYSEPRISMPKFSLFSNNNRK